MKQWKLKEFLRILEKNEYYYSRHNGDYYIYVNKNGRHISVPQKPVDVVCRRLIKEHELDITV